MDQEIPWQRLINQIKPYYPTSGRRDHPPMGLEKILRIYFLQQWYSLSDPAAEEAIFDMESMRQFAGIMLWAATTVTCPSRSAPVLGNVSV